MRFLLVDDSRTMRNIQRKVLSAMAGAEFAEANDGVEALTLISAADKPFDLLVVDWNMPNMDGLSLVQRFRERDRTTPVIMCTTEAEKHRVLEAIKAGANNYVIKPFTPESFAERVQQTLARRAAAAAAA